MLGYGLRQFLVGDRSVCEAGGGEPGDVEPVPGKSAFAAKLTLVAEDVDRSRLFPEKEG